MFTDFINQHLFKKKRELQQIMGKIKPKKNLNTYAQKTSFSNALQIAHDYHELIKPY